MRVLSLIIVSTLLLAGCSSHKRLAQHTAVSVDSCTSATAHRELFRLDSVSAVLDMEFDSIYIDIRHRDVAADTDLSVCIRAKGTRIHRSAGAKSLTAAASDSAAATACSASINDSVDSEAECKPPDNHIGSWLFLCLVVILCVIWVRRKSGR